MQHVWHGVKYATDGIWHRCPMKTNFVWPVTNGKTRMWKHSNTAYAVSQQDPANHFI